MEDNFGWSERTAHNYMRVAEAFRQIRKRCGFQRSLDHGEALYLLSGNGVSDETRKRPSRRREMITTNRGETMATAAAEATTREQQAPAGFDHAR